MSLKKSILLFIFALMLLSSDAYTQTPAIVAPAAPSVPSPALPVAPSVPSSPALPGAPGELGPQGKSLLDKATPGQREALQKELSKSGGKLTPQGIESLKNNPEFKDLKPEDIEKGKELLEKKERESKQDTPAKQDDAAKQEDGEKQAQKTHSDKSKKPQSEHGSFAKGGIAKKGASEEQSLFLRYMSDSAVYDSAGLKPFGYDFFSAKDEGEDPMPDMPVPMDYTVGPGDEISMLLWGRVNERYDLTVSRDGTIFFPNIGSLTVAGMSFDEMKKYLTGQARNIIGAETSITMGSLRSIQVFVLGEVKNPGVYTVSAMSTMANALIASGGPSGIGTLRRVELKRANKKIATLDLYDFLLSGNRANDLRLQNGDVVFVPTVGPLVGIAGNVKRPGIYELNGSTDLESALGLAGGIIPTAYTQQIQVERIERNKRRIIADIDADKDGNPGIKLQDADFVKVFSINGGEANAVFLNGNVSRPGKYELKEKLRLRDILTDEKALLKETHLDYGLIKRATSNGTRLIPFSIAELFKGEESHNIELAAQDSIYVFSKWFFRDKPAVKIEGEVRCGGCSFELNDNLRVKDLVLMAGGLSQDASFGEFELYRTDPRTKSVTLSRYSLEKAMNGGGDEVNIALKDMDRVVIHSVWENVQRQAVVISGDVNRPGKYAYAANMKVSDLIFAAGGFLDSAFLDEAELSSSVIKDGQSFYINYRKLNLRKILAGDSSEDIVLLPDDKLMIKRIPDWNEEIYVSVEGEVAFPGSYIIKKGERLSSVLERAGGFTEKAYLKGAVFTRSSIKEMQQKNIDEAVSRLEKSMISGSVAEVSTLINPEEAKQMQLAIEQKKNLVEKLKTAQAKGRIIVRLDRSPGFKGSINDIQLENGDSLYIPGRPGEINVIGAVYNQTSFIYDPEMSVSSYLGMAGGVTGDADKKNMYILKVDGSSISKRNDGFLGIRWNSDARRWERGGMMSASLDPGDTIVVPETTEKVAWLKDTKDFTQILYQIAVTTGVLIVAF